MRTVVLLIFHGVVFDGLITLHDGTKVEAAAYSVVTSHDSCEAAGLDDITTQDECERAARHVDYYDQTATSFTSSKPENTPKATSYYNSKTKAGFKLQCASGTGKPL